MHMMNLENSEHLFVARRTDKNNVVRRIHERSNRPCSITHYSPNLPLDLLLPLGRGCFPARAGFVLVCHRSAIPLNGVAAPG